MLELITGRAGTGKTTALYNALLKDMEKREKPCLFIVPEQFSFDTERTVLNRFGAEKAQKAEVLSFKRLPDFVFRKTGGMATKRAGEGTETVLMFYCLSQLKDTLEFYSGQTENPQFVKKMLVTLSELDHGRVTADLLRETAKNTSSSLLKMKLNDIALIQETYKALHGEKLDNETDLFNSLVETLETTEILKGTSIFIDGFKGFTKQEFTIIEYFLKQADTVRITLCTDDLYSKNPFCLFASVNETGRKIIDMAKKNNIKVYKKSPADEGAKNIKRFNNPELSYLEENLFNPEKKKFEGKNSNIKIYKARTLKDECNWIAATVRKLIREDNLRCRDIAVVSRDDNTYKKDLLTAFRRYSIPVFDDSRQPVKNQPLFTLCQSVFSILGYGFREESLIRYLKTGLSPVSDRDVALIETYTVRWDLKGSDWKYEFTLHPDGLGVKENEISKKKLERLNDIRKKIMNPLLTLKKETEDNTASEIGKAFYNFLIKTGVPLKLKEFACFYDSEGLTELAKEQNTCWDLLMNILDEIQLALPDIKVPIKTYSLLFDAVISVTDYGTIPQGLDEITIGSAGRVRLADPKVLFAAGCTEGIFPGTPTYTGLLTANDRNVLRESGIELAPSETLLTCEEEFIAYSVLSSASEKLYLSYPLMESSGSPFMPSCVIEGTISLFGKDTIIKESSLTPSWFSETPDSLLRSYGECLQNESEERETLKKALETCNKGKDKVKILEEARTEKTFKIKDSKKATALFGKELYLSASKIDTYYNCPFRYFCQYGLKAEPFRKATLDPMTSGSLIHYILEVILKEHKKDEIENSTNKERKQWIDKALRNYVEENMGGFNDKTERFTYLTERIAEDMAEILERIAAEFKVSDFIPTDFELEIGKSGSHIPCYELPLEQGGKICINGFVDRVDTYKANGKTYIRVVDYKSGGKDFDLTEILYGLNMQMLIYLFAIESGGKNLYGNNIYPAGIFYYPAKKVRFSQDKKEIDELELRTKRLKEGKGSGLFVDDKVALNAMEHDLKGEFIPVHWKKQTKKEKEEGIFSLKGDTLVSKTDIKSINMKVDSLIQEMGNSLQHGNIEADPVLIGAGTSKTFSACTYCDYFPVCRRENPPEKEIFKMKTEKTMEKIKEDLKEVEENV